MNIPEMEWEVMELLWAKGPVTGREATDSLEEKMGWSRSTTLTHLRRMEAKGAVGSSTDDGLKTFFPLITRNDAVLAETESFLDRVHKGSLSLMVSCLTKKENLSQEEISQLHTLLNKMEGGAVNNQL